MTPEAILEVLAEWTLRAAALAAVAGLLLWSLRVKDVSARLATWTIVIFGALLIPIASVVAPRISVSMPRPPIGTHLAIRQNTVVPPTPNISGSHVSEVQPLRNDATGTPIGRPSRERRPGWPAAAVGVWLAVAIAMVLRLAIGLWLSRKLIRKSRPIRDGIRESADVTVPVTVGLIRPVTLLPPDWREWEAWKLEAVLAHERVHVNRHDPALQVAALLYRGLCWFHPLAWWLHAHVAGLAEASSDDAALRVSQDRSRYAEALLGFFARMPRRVAWEGAAIARGRKATRRVERILDSRRKLTSPLTRSAVTAIVAAAFPVVFFAASTRLVWAVAPQLLPPPPLFSSATTPPEPPEQRIAPESVDERVIVIVNDGTDDVVSIPIQHGPRDGNWQWSYPQGSLEGTGARERMMLITNAWREAGGVKLEFGALLGKEEPEANPFERTYPPKGTTKEALGVYSVPEKGELVVDAGLPYGLPVLRFRLGRDPESCLGDLGNVNVTPSLKAERFQQKRGLCEVLLRNLSSKHVLSIGVEEGDLGGRPTGSNWSMYEPNYLHPEMGPGQAFVIGGYKQAKPGQVADVRQQSLSVIYCLFADGTYEGDADSGKRVLAHYATLKSQYARFASFLGKLLATTDEESSLLEEIRAEISRMPDSDTLLEERIIAGLDPKDVPEVRRQIRDSMNSGKRSIRSFLQEFEARPTRTHQLPAPEYWEMRRAWCASWSEAADKLLGGLIAEPTSREQN